MKKGFTLIELLVVVLIIGILSAIALPQYRLAVEKTKALKAFPFLRAIRDAQIRYELANGTKTMLLEDLDIEVPYKEKEEGELTVTYKGTPIGNFLLAADAVFWDRSEVGYTINFYGSSDATKIATCYSRVTKPFGEKVCKSLSKGKLDRLSLEGTNIYILNF